ncbi:MAG: ABC transporter ATP-binding protein [Chloroflexi bacterium]|nr:ABC transporter ATP-binding protein [Chloroflexota bacterium]MDA1240046.1 ABC transporter ATP-binding protein [Chloroflexota bacterium]MQC25570.1 ABC transporter ATP-binding protein [Chloroflexota bacterium]MQC48220.1 ABC transporter ATP-binding protein [Chloroflexota bacterium]
MPPVIDVQRLVKRYGEITALGGVSFQVEPGEIFGILGPNGAGKTTLVEILEGLTRPTEGAATVLGIPVVEHPDAVKERIGVQLQASSYHQYLTLYEILELFGSFYQRRADPMELLRRVHLEDRAGARIKHLSGGMRQRFSIMAALVNEPEVVFFDEPTAGLDPDARRDLWEIVRAVRDSGATVVLTTHYMEEAEVLCDRVAFLNAGSLVALDTPPRLVRSLHAPYHVTLTTSGPIDARRIEQIDGVADVTQRAVADGTVTELRSGDTPRVAAALTALASETGVALLDLAIQPATLEDVFLSLTGRGLSGS